MTRPQPRSPRLARERVDGSSRRSSSGQSPRRTNCRGARPLARKRGRAPLRRTSVPIYNGRIDKTLFVRSVTAAVTGCRRRRSRCSRPRPRRERTPAAPGRRRRRPARRWCARPAPRWVPGRSSRRSRRSGPAARDLGAGLAPRRLRHRDPGRGIPGRDRPHPGLDDEARDQRGRPAPARAGLPVRDAGASRARAPSAAARR